MTAHIKKTCLQHIFCSDLFATQKLSLAVCKAIKFANNSRYYNKTENCGNSFMLIYWHYKFPKAADENTLSCIKLKTVLVPNR